MSSSLSSDPESNLWDFFIDIYVRRMNVFTPVNQNTYLTNLSINCPCSNFAFILENLSEIGHEALIVGLICNFISIWESDTQNIVAHEDYGKLSSVI